MAESSGIGRGGSERSAEGTRNVPVFQPSTEIFETEAALVLSMEMPGVEPDGVNITLDKRVLSVSGRSSARGPQGHALVHCEFRHGDYERSFTLSEAIDGERIDATMNNGVLRLTLPKMQPAPAKTISVKVG